MGATARLLEAAGLGLTDFKENSRSYRLTSQRFPGLFAKVFQEKDIPVQVSLGNYDLGICGSDWAAEILSKYPDMALEKVLDLGYGQGNVYAVTCPGSGLSRIEDILADGRSCRIVSEYPNLAESLALKLRLKRFKVFPLWGAAEAYLPECADLALVNGGIKQITDYGLVPLYPVASTNACLVANRNSWESKDMGELLSCLANIKLPVEDNGTPASIVVRTIVPVPSKPGLLRLALPDGHQKKPTAELLTKAGFVIPGYTEATKSSIDLTGVMIKVIRPQDMPQQVANGNFDLAITGQDWLQDHLCRFPSSPVKQLLELGFGKVRIVAVVVEQLPVNNLAELRRYLAQAGVPWLRVASEYNNLADKFARDNRLSPYRVVPTWGASEAFLPEDADLLVENTQTGQTLAQHHLKIIDTLMTSTACLIGSNQITGEPAKAACIEAITKTLRHALS
jgi:ATP phosphoribosyltransferase